MMQSSQLDTTTTPQLCRRQISLSKNAMETLPTGGGSNFLVRSDSVSKQICHYDDFFNGTYVVHCSPAGMYVPKYKYLADVL